MVRQPPALPRRSTDASRRERQLTLESADGVRLAASIALPADRPLGIAILCHGITTESTNDGSFPPLQDRLLGRGVGVIRFDARAHGSSGGDWRSLSLSGWGADVDAALDLARRTADVPIALLASSFAAGPAITAARRADDCSAMVLWQPALDYERTILSGRSRFSRTILESPARTSLPEWARFEVPGGALLGEGIIHEMRDDRTPAALAGLSIPVLALQGTLDRVVTYRTTRSIVRPMPHVRLVPVPLARHGFRGHLRLVNRISAAWICRMLGR